MQKSLLRMAELSRAVWWEWRAPGNGSHSSQMNCSQMKKFSTWIDTRCLSFQYPTKLHLASILKNDGSKHKMWPNSPKLPLQVRVCPWKIHQEFTKCRVLIRCKGLPSAVSVNELPSRHLANHASQLSNSFARRIVGASLKLNDY